MAFADAGQRVLLAAEGVVFTDEGKSRHGRLRLGCRRGLRLNCFFNCLTVSAAEVPEFLKAASGFACGKMSEIEIVVKNDLRVGGQQPVFGLAFGFFVVFRKNEVNFPYIVECGRVKRGLQKIVKFPFRIQPGATKSSFSSLSRCSCIYLTANPAPAPCPTRRESFWGLNHSKVSFPSA